MPDELAKDGDERLDEAFAAYIQAEEEGQQPDSEKLLARYPELADAVAAHQALGRMVAPVRGFATTVDFQHVEAETLPPGTVIGDYELLEEIGRHGQGVVYQARHIKFKHVVALKMLLSGARATEQEVRRFIEAAEHLALLDHPGIVPIYGGGQYEGRLYFTMKLMEGDLAERTAGRPMKPRDAAGLLVKIAHAVHHAHQRSILHRDLKPSNILLDTDGHPSVADFGLAKRVDQQAPEDRGYMVGAPSFVPPEQITGQTTVLSDVYGLGTIFYWVLTGQAPFAGRTVEETFRKVRQQPPQLPHRLNPQMDHWRDRYLESICLKCLEKEPEQRYPSADTLAVDLQCWLDHRPPLSVPVRWVDRLRLLCLRHPGPVGLTTAALVLLMLVATAAVLVARQREIRLREEVLSSNTYQARFVARTVLYQLQDWATAVVEASERPEFRELLRRVVQDQQLRESLRQAEPDAELRQQLQQHGAVVALQDFLKEVAAKYEDADNPSAESPLENWFVLNTDGMELADSRQSPNVLFADFSGRDHFTVPLQYGREGRRGRDAIHIARVYKALSESLFKLAISAPVYDSEQPDAQLLGILTTTVTTSATLGSHPLHDERRSVALVSRGDPGPRHAGAPPDHDFEYIVLLHPAYALGDEPVEFPAGKLPDVREEGTELRLPSQEQEQVLARDPNYLDPLAERYPEYRGRHLAGLAPVGNTELWVIVQQKYEDAVVPFTRLAGMLMLWLGLAAALVLLLAGATVVSWYRNTGNTRGQNWVA